MKTKQAILIKNKVIEVLERNLLPLNNDESLIKIHYSGICSSDIYRGFSHGAYFYPLVMGHEFAGIIEKASSQSSFKAGQKVAVFPLLPCFNCSSCQKEKYAQCLDYKYYGSRVDGGYSTFINIKNWNLVAVPENVNLKNAAMLEPISVVLHALELFDFNKKKKKLAILGTGFLGLIAASIIRQQRPGLEVVCFDRNHFKLDIAKEMGFTVELIGNEILWDTALKSYKDHFDYILESCGSNTTYIKSIELAARFAQIVWMGNIIDDLLIPKTLVSSLLRKEITIRGSWNSTYFGTKKSNWTQAVKLLSKGLDLTHLITKLIDLESVEKFLKKLHNHKIRKEKFEAIKVMVEL